MFLDQANPYRRKSSLVSSDLTPPVFTQTTKRDQCLVHHFLESQRRARGDPSSAKASGNRHETEASPTDTQTDGPSSNSVIDPKGKAATTSQRRAIVDRKSIDHNGPGQPDQEAWTREMTKSLLEDELKKPNQAKLGLNHEDSGNIHSRLLTKKQLSDMAWGVRELSRRLSSMRIRFRVKTIFVLTKIYDQHLISNTRELTKWLLDKDRDTHYTVYVQDRLKGNKKFDMNGLIEDVAKGYCADGKMDAKKADEEVRRRLRFWTEEMCISRPHMFDFVITLGGDGTVLYASWLFQRIVPPVLSFALGSLGFLTKFDFVDFRPTLDTAFNKGVAVSLRLRFEGTIMRSQRRKVEAGGSVEDEEELNMGRDLVEELIGEEREDARTHRPSETFEILNEIVVDRGPNPSKFLLPLSFI